MKVRLSPRRVDIRELPLDGFDMFLLTRLDRVLSLAQLVDLAPCDREQTMRRLHRLAQLRVVEIESDFSEEESPTMRPAAHQASSVDEDALTLRPPRASGDDAMTLRPPRPAPLPTALGAHAAFADADTSTVSAVVARTTERLERRPTKSGPFPVQREATPRAEQSTARANSRRK